MIDANNKKTSTKPQGPTTDGKYTFDFGVLISRHSDKHKDADSIINITVVLLVTATAPTDGKTIPFSSIVNYGTGDSKVFPLTFDLVEPMVNPSRFCLHQTNWCSPVTCSITHLRSRTLSARPTQVPTR